MTTFASPFPRRRLLAGASALALANALLARTANAAPSKAMRRLKSSRRPATAITPPKLSPEELALVRGLAAKGRHAIASAATDPGQAFADGSIAAAAATLLGSQSSPRRVNARVHAQQLFTAPELQRKARFGALLSETPTLHKKKRREKDIEIAAQGVANKPKKKKENKNNDGPHYERLEFHLNWMECMVETDEVGADEILLGGQLVRPSGNITKIPGFKVSNEFDQGEWVNYDYSPCDLGFEQPPMVAEQFCRNGGPNDPFRGRTLANAKLREGTYLLVLMLGEEDTAGGFIGFLQHLYKALDDEIRDAMTGVATAFAGPFGWAIAEVIGEILDFLCELVDNPDDAIAMRTWAIGIGHDSLTKIREEAEDPLPAPNGVWASPMRRMSFGGDGGRYDAGLHWRAFK